MSLLDLIRAPRRAFNTPDGAGTGGGDTVPGGAGGADSQPGGAGAGGGAPWWQAATIPDDVRQHLTVKGLTVDDPAEAVVKLAGMHRQAEARLGKPADQLIERPKDGQDVADWLAARRKDFGLPEAPDGYKIERPESWPKDAAWDDKLEAAVRAQGVELGLSQKQVQGLTALYANRIAEIQQAIEGDYAAAEADMQAALKKDWGDQTKVRMARAAQAASAVAERAGLSAEGIEALTKIIGDKAGSSAAAVRMFDAIAEMMADDRLPGGGSNLSRAGGLGMSPAEARAELARISAPGGEYYDAVASGDAGRISKAMEQFTRLTKIAAT